MGAFALTISYHQYHQHNHDPDHDPSQEAQEDDEEQAGEHSNYQPSAGRERVEGVWEGKGGTEGESELWNQSLFMLHKQTWIKVNKEKIYESQFMSYMRIQYQDWV